METQSKTNSIENVLDVSLEEFKNGKIFELNVDYNLNKRETLLACDITEYHQGQSIITCEDSGFKNVLLKKQKKVKARLWHCDLFKSPVVAKYNITEEIGFRPANILELLALGQLKIEIDKPIDIYGVGSVVMLQCGFMLYKYVTSIAFPKGPNMYLTALWDETHGYYLAIENEE